MKMKFQIKRKEKCINKSQNDTENSIIKRKSSEEDLSCAYDHVLYIITLITLEPFLLTTVNAFFKINLKINFCFI